MIISCLGKDWCRMNYQSRSDRAKIVDDMLRRSQAVKQKRPSDKFIH